MSLLPWLSDLEERGVKLRLEGEALRYRGPREVLTAEVLAELARRKSEVVALLAAGDALPAVVPVERPARVPLSYGQQQLWLLHRLRPEVPTYNEGMGLRLRGPLDGSALRRSFEELCRRHEVLRTRLVEIDGAPVQEVLPEAPPPWRLVDLAAVPERRRHRELERQVQRVVRLPFDLTQPPLLRLALFRCGGDEHLLVLVVHHAIHDGESLKALAREIGVLYEALRRRSPQPLAPPRLHYADYALWQRRHLTAETLAPQVEAWRRLLDGIDPILDLPRDRPRPRRPSFRGARLPLRLSPPTVAAARRLARSSGTSLFTVLFTAYAAVLGRHAGRERLIVGVPRSGRTRPELAELLGFIVNPQPVPVDLSMDPPFRRLVASVRDTLAEVEEQAAVPFQVLVEALDATRDTALNPLFQVSFAFQEDPGGAIALRDLELQPEAIFTGVAKFDFDLSLTVAGELVQGYLDFSRELFDESRGRRFAAHLLCWLEAAVGEPDRRLSEIPLLTPAERHQLLVEWRNDDGATAAESTIHGLFAAHAVLHGERPALRWRDGERSYAELASRATCLAGLLQRSGAGPGDRVALLLESPELQVEAMLAVLQTGAAFVVLDPRWPEERLAALVAEVTPAVLVTETALREPAAVLGRRPEAPPQLLADGAAISDHPPLRPVTVAPAAAAYVAFTSGSTGSPKGIVQSHRSFCQFLAWQARRFAIAPGGRVAQWSTPTYDAAYCEIFGALAFGACLCLAERDVRQDPVRCLSWLAEEAVTLFQTVPSFFRGVWQAAGADPRAMDALARLEVLLLAGEVLPADLARAVVERLGRRPRLFNLYGPSEVVLAAAQEVDRREAAHAEIAVGRPLDGRQVLVLDRRGLPCPAGVPGEVWVRSEFLTDGYFQRPGATADAYRPDPGGRPGSRLYRTGDLARWRGDGALEFRGRRDGQLKLRGMRVEPGEVEAVLVAYPGIRECVVAVRTEEGGDPRLVAYVVTDAALPRQDLLRWLRQRLPLALVPACLVLLDRLPRTATGKLDRGALPAPGSDGLDLRPAYVEPRTASEREVGECWQQVLGVERVGAEDDFFALGGNSLQAVQALHRLAAQTGVDLPLSVLWSGPTVSALAERLDGSRSERARREREAAELLDWVRGLADDEVERLLRPGEAASAPEVEAKRIEVRQPAPSDDEVLIPPRGATRRTR